MADLCDAEIFNYPVWLKIDPPEKQCPILKYAFSFTYVVETPQNFICGKFQLVVSWPSVKKGMLNVPHNPMVIYSVHVQ